MSTAPLPSTLTRASIASYNNDEDTVLGREVKHLKAGMGLGVTIIACSLLFALIISSVHPGTALATTSLYQMAGFVSLGVVLASVCAYRAHRNLGNDKAYDVLSESYADENGMIDWATPAGRLKAEMDRCYVNGKPDPSIR